MPDPLTHLSQQLDAIADVAERAAARTEALNRLRDFQAEQKTKRQLDVQHLHDDQGMSFADIAQVIGGLTRGRAKQIYDGDSTNHGQRQRAATGADDPGRGDEPATR